MHNVFKTTYHPETNGKVEKFNRNTFPIFAYIGYYLRDCDLYSSVIFFQYNFQPQELTMIFYLDLVLSRPPGTLALEAQQNEPRSTND